MSEDFVPHKRRGHIYGSRIQAIEPIVHIRGHKTDTTIDICLHCSEKKRRGYCEKIKGSRQQEE